MMNPSMFKEVPEFQEMFKWQEEVIFAQEAYNNLMDEGFTSNDPIVISVVHRVLVTAGFFYNELEKLEPHVQDMFWM